MEEKVQETSTVESWETDGECASLPQTQPMLYDPSLPLGQWLDSGFQGDEAVAALRVRLGVDNDTWEGWLREGILPGQVVRLSRCMAEMYAPWVWSSLLKLTEDGSVPAMKLYFDLCKAEVAGEVGGSNASGEILRLRREIFGEKAGDGR